MTTVVITGAGTGLLGREATLAFAASGHQAVPLSHGELDVTDADAVQTAFETIRPDLVVHCAAMTNVDACESEPDLATAVNARGSANVAREAQRTGAPVIAISTDYVFDGRKGQPYSEQDPAGPVQVYGRTKLEGEVSVREATDSHWIVRSAWIYGVGGKSFISKLPALAAAGGTVSAVRDQTGSPTSAADLARALVELSRAGAPYGTYHVTNSGSCTFAELVRHALGPSRTDVKEVSWRDLGLAAARPENTSLANLAWMGAGLPPLRPWQEAVLDFMSGASA